MTTNEQWFGAAQYGIRKVVDEEFADEGEDRLIHTAWLEGGLYLARHGVEEMETLREAWGEGGLEQASGLTSVFTQCMIYRWYKAFAAQMPERERDSAILTASENVLNLLGQDCSQGAVNVLTGIAVQFDYECKFWQGDDTESAVMCDQPFWGDLFQNPLAYHLDQDQLRYIGELCKLQLMQFAGLKVVSPDLPLGERAYGVVVWEYILVMSRALEALGYEPIIDWGRQQFPVKRNSELLIFEGSYPDSLSNDFAMWLGIVNNASRVMFVSLRDDMKK